MKKESESIKVLLTMPCQKITIDLNAGMVRALKWFARRQFHGSYPSAAMVEILLKLALANPKDMVRLINKYSRYRNEEGFTNGPEGATSIDLLNSLVAGRQEYRHYRAVVKP